MSVDNSEAGVVELEVADGVGVITIRRPSKLNALTQPMMAQLESALIQASTDPEARVVVLTGAGDAFCVGEDVGALRRFFESASPEIETPRPGIEYPGMSALTAAPLELRSTHLLAPAAMEKLCIAAINGPCAGIGLALAAHCDVRFASSTASFTAAFPQRGLTAELGLAYVLQWVCGSAHAADICLSGRTIDATEAEHMGLVNRVIDRSALREYVMTYAQHVADTASPRSIRIIKRQLRDARQQDLMSALATSWDEVSASLQSEDFREGVNAFIERRPPRFTGR